MSSNPELPPVASATGITPSVSSRVEPPFFAVSILKFVTLSFLTCGIYEVYWFYMNWRHIRARERTRIWPVPRAIFSIFYCYRCFSRIRDYETPTITEPPIAAGPLATGWIIASLVCNFTDSYWWVSLFAFVFMVPVQMRANDINAAITPEHDRNDGFTVWNWITIVLGTVFVTCALLGTLHPNG
jgi:hypothetical protein